MQCSAWRPTSSASTCVRPVVEQHEVELARPSPVAHAGPDRRVRVHPLGGRGARQQLQHHLEVAPLGQHLLDPHHRDQDLGQRRAHPPVALGLDDADRAGLGDAEVRAADRHRHRQELLAQVTPRASAIAAGSEPELPALRDRALEQRRDLGAVAVDRGHEDVRRLVVAELDDQLGQVGLDRLDPAAASASLSPISSVASDLTLMTSSAPWSRAIPATIAFASAPSRAQWTVPPAAVTAPRALELLGQRRHRARLDRRARVAQLLPVRQLGDGPRRA